MAEVDEIERAAAIAEAETGARNGAAKLRLCRSAAAKTSGRRWTAREADFVRQNYGRITREEIAAKLGRSPFSILNLVKRDLHLVAPSKSPDILTAEQVACGIGLDGHSVHRLMDRGLMPHRRLPDRDLTRIIDRHAFMLWILDPRHWCYFRPERVGALHLMGRRTLAAHYDFEFWESARAKVLEAKASWKDEWLTPGQAAAAIGFRNRKTGTHSINEAVRCGNLKATRWGNWWILRSALPAADMTINAYGRIVPKVKPEYQCPRGMAHANRSTCMKLRFCREAYAKAYGRSAK